MTPRITIDPNVRVDHNRTYAGFEDVEGGETVNLGMTVEVVEPEANLVGRATVTDVDAERELIYLEVDWPSLKVPSAEGLKIKAKGQDVTVGGLTAVAPGFEGLRGTRSELSGTLEGQRT